MTEPDEERECCGEPLLDPGPEHFILFPLKNSMVASASCYTESDMLTTNLVQRFSAEVQIPEFRMFYDFQAMMENVHWEVYSLRSGLCIGSHPMLLSLAAVEGIFFSGSFAAIFWLKKKELMLGLTFSNKLISRDEGLHTDFACFVYSCLHQKLSENTLTMIVTEASELEQDFWKDILVDGILGLSAPSMVQYIKFVTDRLLVVLDVSKVYNTQNPFEFVEMISLEGKTNFFEHRVSDYAKAFVTGKGLAAACKKL
ncbi:ferritin-like superfamily [Armillaria borealis]|uniref:Ferritin-like superfamily n=1 Tax=Armillaria borealis TaxID=47425 RepID=A0AA39ME80_9AGAR|nr:ferritin-like superfamily [Armillaria borealis]